MGNWLGFLLKEKAVIERNTCRACLGKSLEFLMDLGPQPLAGGFLLPTEDARANEKLYPLPIYICHDCGLVQTTLVISPEILFTNYCFSSSTISSLVNHFNRYARWLKQEYAPRSVVEFGCNDGVLLKQLEKIGIKACGVDVSENITKLAREKGLNVITGFFNQNCADHVLSNIGKVDIVTGSNCFPHNDDPDEIIITAKKILKPTGHFCVEVMYAADLLNYLQWDSMYHEHLSYYCLHTLETLFSRFNMHIVNVKHVPMHAGSLRAVVAMDPFEKPQESVINMLNYEKKIGLISIDTWRSFANDIKHKIAVVKNIFDWMSTNSRIWAYGASGRATMWLNACKMNYLEAIVDSSPLRSGRLMPGTHTPIVFPEKLNENSPDIIFIPAWNYADIIMKKEAWYDGIWAVPLPSLKFI